VIYTLNIVNQGPDTIYPKDSISYRAVHDYNFSKTIVNRAIGITVVPGDSFQINDSISINTGVTDSVLLSFQPPIVAFGPNEGKGMLTAEFEETRNDNSPRFKFFNIGKAAVSKSNAKNNRITVFPNPTHDKIKLTATSPINTVRVFGMDGRMLITHDGQHKCESIDLSDLQPGIYIIETQTTTNTKWTTRVTLVK